MKRLACAAFSVFISCVGASAHAQEVDEATRGAVRGLASEGAEHYQAGRYDQALSAFQRAYTVMRVPSLGLWTARSLEKTGRLVKASERYLEVSRLPVPADSADVHKQAQADALTEREALLPRIPGLRLQIDGAETSTVEATIDGQPIAAALLGARVPVDPGQHEVVATAAGRTARETVTVAEGQMLDVPLKLDAASAAAAASPEGTATAAGSGEAEPSEAADAGGSAPVLGYVVGGVGALGLGVSLVTGGLALGKKGTVSDECTDGPGDDRLCEQAGLDAGDSGKTLATISTVAFAVGAVGLGVGLYLILSHDDGRPTTALGTTLTPGGAFVGLTRGF